LNPRSTAQKRSSRSYSTLRTRARSPLPRCPDSVQSLHSKCEAKAEMEGAARLVLARMWIDPVIETNRSDRQIVAQTRPDAVTHVVQARIARLRQEITGVDKDRS